MDEIARPLFTLLPPAVGLFVFGTLSLLAPRVAVAWRLAVGGLAATAGYALPGVFDVTTDATRPIACLTATAVVAAAVRVTPLTDWLRTPLGYGSVFAVAGLIGLAGTFVHYEQATDAADDMASVDRLSYTPERVEAGDVHLTTDRGYSIPVCRAARPRTRAEVNKRSRETLAAARIGDAAILRDSADEETNCHGWLFTGGRYIVPGAAVEQILQDNGYEPVPTAAVGDLVVYRGSAGEVLHTAVVRYVAPGRPPMVEGKWGWMGVYLHAADECSYGQQYTFYRSHRDGDLLRGLDGSTGVRLAGAE